MRKINRLTTLSLAIIAAAFIHCGDDNDDLLAPYTGSRPLQWLHVTKSTTPDIQWIGGRVAAAGVNRGSRAAFDSTLIWLRTSPDNQIGSYITFGSNPDLAAISRAGGNPAAYLTDSTQYTFWLADKSALTDGRPDTASNPFTFIDTSFVMNILVRGKLGGERNSQGKELVDIVITRNETMLEDSYTITWTPAEVAFRQIAIRTSSLGGFTDLLWHIVTPDSLPDNIHPPVRIGIAPPGTEEAVAWPESGFIKNKVQILWMTNSKWKVNNFAPTAAGYAWLRLYPFE